MANLQNNIWGNSEKTFFTDSLKVPLNRNNLKVYFESHRNQVDIESFLLFFQEKSISKADEETGNYLSHMLYQDRYNREDCQKLLSFLFHEAYLSPYFVNNKGELYLESAIKSLEYGASSIISLLCEAWDSYSIDIPSHRDFQGNNLAHWLLVRTKDNGLKQFFPYLSKSMLYSRNNNGINVLELWNLAHVLFRSNYVCSNCFTYQKIGDQILLDTCNPKGSFKDLDHSQIIRTPISVNKQEYIYNYDEILSRFLNNELWRSIYLTTPSKSDMENADYGSYYRRK